MKVINGAAFRKRQKEHLDECESSGEYLCVITQKQGRDPQQMVITTKAQYDLMVSKIKEGE